MRLVHEKRRLGRNPRSAFIGDGENRTHTGCLQGILALQRTCVPVFNPKLGTQIFVPVPRPGIEPGLQRSKRCVRPPHSQGIQRKVRDSNPQSMLQPARLATEFLIRPDTFHHMLDDRGGIRTRTHQALDPIAIPISALGLTKRGTRNSGFHSAFPVPRSQFPHSG